MRERGKEGFDFVVSQRHLSQRRQVLKTPDVSNFIFADI